MIPVVVVVEALGRGILWKEICLNISCFAISPLVLRWHFHVTFQILCHVWSTHVCELCWGWMGTLHTTEELRVRRGPNLPGKVAKDGSVEPRSIMLSPISRAPVAVRLQDSFEVLSYINVWKSFSYISDLDLDFLKLGMLSLWAQEERQQDDLCRIGPCSFCILKNHNYLTVLARARKQSACALSTSFHCPSMNSLELVWNC